MTGSDAPGPRPSAGHGRAGGVTTRPRDPGHIAGDPLVTLRHAGVRFGAVQALAGVDLVLHRGECLALVGRALQALIDDALVCGMHVHDHQALRVLGQHVHAADLADRAPGAMAALFFIDLALPRDVEPAVAEFANVFLYNLDDLAKITEENRAARAAKVDHARLIISGKAEQLWRQVEPQCGGLHPALIAPPLKPSEQV